MTKIVDRRGFRWHRYGRSIVDMLDPGQIIHWTLCRAGRRLTCVERLIPNGSECSVLYDGLPVAVRVLPSGRHVETWAARIRSVWEPAGGFIVGPSRSSVSSG